MARVGINLFKSERKIFMSAIPKELIKDLIREQKFNNTTEVMHAIKEMFKDVLEEVMEAELDAELGYEKQERRPVDSKKTTKNYHNGYSKKKK
ncbi:MAG: family transposase [Sporomusa sp.]|nr:family transposase [Sporomusa sp.]